MADWDKRSVKEMRREQDRKLRAFVREQLYPYSPYYRKLFKKHNIDPDSIRSVADLAKIPFTTKADIAPSRENRSKYRDIILQPDQKSIKKYYPKGRLIRWKLAEALGGRPLTDRIYYEYKPVHLHFTTGRSAMPTPFAYSSRDIDRLKEAGSRLFQVFGFRSDMTCINAFPYSPHLAFWLVFFAAQREMLTALHTGGGKVLGSEKIVTALESMKASAMTSLPGYGYHLLKMAAEQKKDLSRMEIVVFGGERLPPGLRVKIMELLGEMGAKNPKVVATYASTELRLAYGECVTKDLVSHGYHTYPDWEIIEIIDPKTGEPVGDGESGEITYSALDWRGSCLLRYRTGDLAKGGLTWERCPVCGRTAPRISAEITRVSDMKEFNLSKVKGTLVDLNAFHPLLSGHPGVDEWQLEIYKPEDDEFETDRIDLYLSVRAGHSFEKVSQEVVRQILHEAEIRPNRVHECTPQEMEDRLCLRTELKEKRIIDRRPK